MWKFRNRLDLFSINERLDALESTLNPDGTSVELNVLKQEIVALRATQEHSQKDSELIERRVEQLTIAVGEGIERVERDERRIKATVQRARKELKESGLEHEGLEAEAHDLRLVDGAGSDESGVPPVPDQVEEVAPEPSSVRGVPLDALRRVRGY